MAQIHFAVPMTEVAAGADLSPDGLLKRKTPCPFHPYVETKKASKALTSILADEKGYETE